MDDTWTLQALVAEAVARLEALPPPKNGQVRAVPDDRTIRYYGSIGLLDRPAAMRGRTALYGRRHLAQVVAIKRMQSAGKSLAEIQTLWPTLDDVTLARMSGVTLPATKTRATRKDFWKRGVEGEASPIQPSSPSPSQHSYPVPPRAMPFPQGGAGFAPDSPVELRIEIAPGAFLTVGVSDGVSLSPADVRALRAAAAPLATELAKRGLTAQVLGTMEEP